MKVRLYITADGLERLAKGQVNYLNSWHWAIRKDDETPLENSLEVGAVEVTLPTQEQCVSPALAELNKRIQSTLANTQQEVKELQERCADLACLAYSPPAEVL